MNRTSFRRVAAPTVAALALGMSLTACGAGNEEQLLGRVQRQRRQPQRHPERRRRQRPGGRPGRLAGRLPVRQHRRHRQLRPGRLGRWPRAVPRRRRAFAGSDSYMDDEELAASKETCGGTEAFEVPGLRQPDRPRLQPRGRRRPAAVRRDARRHLLRQDHQVERPGDRGRQPGRSSCPSTAITPVHRSDDSGTQDNFTQYLSAVAPDVWTEEADGVWPLKSGEGANGTSGVIESVTNGAGSIGFADESQAGDLSIAKVKVGERVRRPDRRDRGRRSSTSRRGSRAVPPATSPSTWTARPPRPVPTRSSWCPTSSPARPTTTRSRASWSRRYLSYVVGTDGQQAAAKTAGSAPLSSTLSDEADGPDREDQEHGTEQDDRMDIGVRVPAPAGDVDPGASARAAPEHRRESAVTASTAVPQSPPQGQAATG